MGQELERRAEAVVGILVDEAAERREEAPCLRARIMEDASRAPARRAAHDRGVTVLALDARKLTGDEVERMLPGDRHEALAPSALAALRPTHQIAFAHHRACNASRRMHRLRDRFDQRRWIGIARKRLDADDAPVTNLGVEGAPVRVLRDKSAGHDRQLMLRSRGRTDREWIESSATCS